MPKSRGPSRSLFASLPPSLKYAIRAQGVAPPPPPPTSDIEIKEEMIERVISSGALLPTQPPPSPPLSPPNEGDIVDLSREEEIVVDVQVEAEAGPSRLPASAGSSAATDATPSSGTERLAPAVLSITYAPRSTPTRPPAQKKRKRGSTPFNPHLSHPWDCAGLVPRYHTADEVPRDLAKYFHQRHFFFPRYDELPLLIDRTGWYSVTPQPIAKHIAERCRCDVIVDAFCGIGGNAIEFAKTCERVIAIDNDLTRLKLARHNALHCGVADRIEFVHADFVEFARTYAREAKRGKKRKQDAIDVVFLSPPWGGPDYLDAQVYPLSQLEPIPGQALMELSVQLSPNVAFYLPRNVDVPEVSRLARRLDPAQQQADGREREWVEVEEEWVGDKLKAVTAYFGGLVADA